MHAFISVLFAVKLIVGNPGRQRVEPLEVANPARAAKLKTLIGNIQGRNEHETASGKTEAGRTFHHGQIFAATGLQRLHFRALPAEVQSYLKGGIFDPASYGGQWEMRTILRASHGRPNPPGKGQLEADERGPDVRGLAWLWQVGAGEKEWQALTTTGPARTQFVPTGLHFAELFDAITAKDFTSIPRRLGVKTTVKAAGKLVAGTMPAGDLLRNIMESSAAIQVGEWQNVPARLRPRGAQGDDPIVARFALVPRYRPYSQSLLSRLGRGVAYGKLVNRDAKYQRRGVSERLGGGPMTYDVQLQFYIDDEQTPIDDSSRAWSRQVAKPITVASIEVDRQDIDVDNPSDFERLVYQYASFGPQVKATNLSVPARPAGQMAQDRDSPYMKSEKTRGGDNAQMLRFVEKP